MHSRNIPIAIESRRGITLMEVLISIGIIAIGLTSVMSLIPAGKSEAGKAVIYDRAATMAMNGLADAITFGLTRPDSFVAAAAGSTTVVYDPANVISWPAGVAVGTLKPAGVLSQASDALPANPADVASLLVVAKLFSQGRDDVVYNRPATEDGFPSNSFLNGIRGFDGRTTSLIALTQADSGTPPLAAGDLVTVTVVVFHNRDTTTPIVAGAISSAGLVNLTPPAGRTLKSIIRTGTVLYYVDTARNRLRFAQLSMAAVDTNTGDAYVTFSGRPIPSNPTTPIYVLVDSVGLAEQTASLEGPTPFGQ